MSMPLRPISILASAIGLVAAGTCVVHDLMHRHGAPFSHGHMLGDAALGLTCASAVYIAAKSLKAMAWTARTIHGSRMSSIRPHAILGAIVGVATMTAASAIDYATGASHAATLIQMASNFGVGGAFAGSAVMLASMAIAQNRENKRYSEAWIASQRECTQQTGIKYKY